MFEVAVITGGRADWSDARVVNVPHVSWRQRLLLEALAEYQQQHGWTPSYRELAELIGVAQVSTVRYHVDQLVAKGVLRHDPRTQGALQILA